MQFHHYSLTDLEQMLPWERKIYLKLVNNYVQEENERIKLENQQQRRRK